MTKIRKLRKEQEISQEELANLCGSTQQQVAKIERGLVDPKLSTLTRIADALGCELKELFFSRDEFVAEVNSVIEESEFNLAEASLLELNTICTKKKFISSFHPFWEEIKVVNNHIEIKKRQKGNSNE